MTDWVTPDGDAIRLHVGCQFDLRSLDATTAVLQVAPHGNQPATITGEWWGGAIPHRPYLDELADDLLRWVMPSRFCQPDELGSDAWHIFGSVAPGWARVQAICDFVNAHLAYVHGSSNPWTTAADAYRSGQGVCRDFAHLAITFCRALNIPARYAFGYIPDIGNPPPYEVMDFAAWFEVYLSGRWHTFDARLNQPRIGRVLVGRGRDAVDVAQMTTFGPVALLGFVVTADQLV
jgi:transglutaminase-like putative cysteine protease